jgi:serine protease
LRSRSSITHTFRAGMTALALAAAAVSAAGCGEAPATPAPAGEQTATPGGDPRQALPATFAVDPARAAPRVRALPGTPARPVAAIEDRGQVSQFVEDELLLWSDDPARVAELAARWQGEVTSTLDAAAQGLGGVPRLHVLRVRAERADVAALPDNLRALDPRSTGAFAVSSARALALLAAAAEEARAGLTISINWVQEPHGFMDMASMESPAGPDGYSPNAFEWSYFKRGGVQDIGVTAAWQALELHQRLNAKVKVAVIDGGFIPNADFPAWHAYSVLPNAPTNVPSPIPGNPWHGTLVSQTLAGLADNGFGAAGVAGPVADLITVHTFSDIVTSSAAVIKASAEGARVINMSYGVAVPATLSWTVEPFELVTDQVQAAGRLLFASAGNDSKNVDAEDCLQVCVPHPCWTGICVSCGEIACWEQRWHYPCENDGVICVGGLAPDSRARDGKSNYGSENVDIWAPFQVWSGPEPTVASNVPTDQITRRNGTSFSSPFVAGVAALVWAADPGLSASDVRQTLYKTAHEGGGAHVNLVVNAFGAVKQALKVQNFAPQVEILAPASGAEVGYGGIAGLVLEARATDLEDGPDCCTIHWVSEPAGLVATGKKAAATFTAPGTYAVRAVATDAGGVVGTSAPITVVAKNLAPVAKITSPKAGEALYAGVPVKFQSEATDPNVLLPLACEARQWVLVGVPAVTKGCDFDMTFSQPGAFTVRLIVTDPQGATAMTQLTVNVLPQPSSGAPIVSIVQPAKGQSLPRGHNLTLIGYAKDPDVTGGVFVPIATQWRVRLASGQEKVIGQGLSYTWVPPTDVSFSCGGQKVTIIFSATDADGTSTAEVELYLSDPPC